MNSKKVNRLFLSIILLHIAVVTLLTVFSPVFTLDLVPNFILSGLLLAVPAAVAAMLSGVRLPEILGFHRIRISSVWMIVLFTFLSMPLTIVINAVSMLFVDNTVAGMSNEILEKPFWVILLLVGVFAPFCEECTFRGVVYRGYRRSGTVLQSILLSALLFGLMHMNFNQAAYAVVIGVMLALLVEATGSLWGSLIYHIVFNSEQVCLMYLTQRLMTGNLAESAAGADRQMIMTAISVYLIIAAISTALAACVLVWIAKNENREENLRAIWSCRKEKRDKMFTIPLILAVVLSLTYMCLQVVLTLQA